MDHIGTAESELLEHQLTMQARSFYKEWFKSEPCIRHRQAFAPVSAALRDLEDRRRSLP